MGYREDENVRLVFNDLPAKIYIVGEEIGTERIVTHVDITREEFKTLLLHIPIKVDFLGHSITKDSDGDLIMSRYSEYKCRASDYTKISTWVGNYRKKKRNDYKKL